MKSSKMIIVGIILLVAIAGGFMYFKKKGGIGGGNNTSIDKLISKNTSGIPGNMPSPAKANLAFDGGCGNCGR